LQNEAGTTELNPLDKGRRKHKYKKQTTTAENLGLVLQDFLSK